MALVALPLNELAVMIPVALMLVGFRVPVTESKVKLLPVLAA